MPIDYRMHSTDDRWWVYDLSVEGISLVANYRAQLNQIIRTSSYEALVWKFKLLKRNPQCRPPRNALRHESEGRPPRLSDEWRALVRASRATARAPTRRPLRS